jgi:3'(2'), 5'-bisphosphate nucleotidase
MKLRAITDALSEYMPPVLRWAGAIAQQLQHFNISITGKKTSGSASTDALTLADLSVQELLVAALRDGDPMFRQCRLEAEESTGDLKRFAAEGKYTIAIDPIDGTKRYQEGCKDGWCVTFNLRSVETVHYSLVYIPGSGENGRWVAAIDNRIVCGDDDLSRPASEVLHTLARINPGQRPDTKRIYLTGFQQDDLAKVRRLNEWGLDADMLRLPGIVACSANRETLATLCDLAKHWNPVRYRA